MQKTLQISETIIPKIPQFWSSAYSAFAELIQNAFRSGATCITIQTSPEEGLLVIRDNGRGIHSLDDFLTVGNSDWKKAVVEPAGMGFYAHLGYAQKTTVTSLGQRYVFTPACLTGAPVEILKAPGSDWTTIRVQGIEPNVLRNLEFQRMRPLPDPEEDIRYRVNGEDEPNLLVGLTALELPVGTVYLIRTDSPSRFPVGIWEGLPIGFSDVSFRSANGKTRVWAASPACSVRPQLPGREHFIRDEAYRNAQQEIEQAVEAYCRSRAETLSLNGLPETFDYRQPLASALAPLGIHEKDVVSWVKEHFYRTLETFDGAWNHDEYDSPEYPETTSRYVRIDRIVPFSLGNGSSPWETEAVEVLLNSQAGCWETWVPHTAENQAKIAYQFTEGGLPLKLDGLRVVGEGWAAEKVTIGGRVVLEAPAVFLCGGQPVWIGAPQAVLDHARALACFWHYAEHSAEDGSWYEWIGENRDFDDDLLERSLAAWYGLGEAVNLRNWVKRTHASLTGWNGPPRSVIRIFQVCLEVAAWLARQQLHLTRWKTTLRLSD